VGTGSRHPDAAAGSGDDDLPHVAQWVAGKLVSNFLLISTVKPPAASSEIALK
jgi:hypothetical protein